MQLVNNDYSGGYSLDSFWFTSNQPAPYSIEVRWFVDITVHDSQGNPVPGAAVSLEGTGERVSGTTGPGGTLRLIATQYSQSGTNQRENTTAELTQVTPLELQVQAEGIGPHSESIDVTGPVQRTVVLQ